MPLCTRHLHTIARTPAHRKQWRQISRRCYSSEVPSSAQNTANPEDAAWFQKLRTEMLNRELPLERDTINSSQERKLEAALHPFIPHRWKQLSRDARAQPGGAPDSIGNHLIYCNPAVPDDNLLSDGTDKIHSPGGAFVRRMWAGGSVRLNKDLFYNPKAGWGLNKPIVCSERIKDVRLRGEGDSQRIFLTIERNFARYGLVNETSKGSNAFSGDTPYEDYRKTMEIWNQYFLTEDRNIVFMHERSSQELDDVKAGKMAPVKYLQSPGEPQFSHFLTPTTTLLSRFSALTYNAHHIHLDRDYARNVEGHRNLLVHGPLTLALMLKFIGAQLEALPEGPHFVQAIEYRNLAPLYCDEELRLCAREKEGTRMGDGRIYDVWVEGPTGGMAVKGLVRTAPRPAPTRKPSSKDSLVHREHWEHMPFLRPISSPSSKWRENQRSEHEFGTASVIRNVVSDSDATYSSPPTNSANHTRKLISRYSARAKRQARTNITEADITQRVPKSMAGLTPFSLPSVEKVVPISRPSSTSKFSSESPQYHPQPTNPLTPNTEVTTLPAPFRASLRSILRSHRRQYIRIHSPYDPVALNAYLHSIRHKYLTSTTTIPPSSTPSFLLPARTTPLIRPIHNPRPLIPSMSFRSRNILLRRPRSRTRSLRRPYFKPLPLIRYHNRNPASDVANSAFALRGVIWEQTPSLTAEPRVRKLETPWRTSKKWEEIWNERRRRSGSKRQRGTEEGIVGEEESREVEEGQSRERKGKKKKSKISRRVHATNKKKVRAAGPRLVSHGMLVG